MADEIMNQEQEQTVKRGRPAKPKTSFVKNVGSHVIIIGQPTGDNVFLIPEAEAVEVSDESLENPEVQKFIEDGVLVKE